MDNKDNSEKPADSLPKQKQLTKDELISSVREWIKIDTEISKLKADVKGKINKQKQLTDSLVQVMKHNPDV